MSHILHYRRGLDALALAAFFIAVPALARAQAASVATIALVRELPDSTARATIVRTATSNIVLLRERDADAATLATAMASLYRAQKQTIDSPDKKLVINLHGQRSLASLKPDERQAAEKQLARVREAKVGRVEGVGEARATTIALEARK